MGVRVALLVGLWLGSIPDGSLGFMVGGCKRFRQSNGRLAAVEDVDRKHMATAIDLARKAGGNVFPNPNVGCILVDPASDEVRGRGWHPRAGWPHAEIYALADCSGRLPEASRSSGEGGSLTAADDELLADYLEKAQDLFASCADGLTAYVTLEPCSHRGKRTPPCADTLVAAGVKRVVLGSQDPNPSVDGGGIQVLESAGVTVEVMNGAVAKEAQALITNFRKRICGPAFDESQVTGAQRSALRRLANQRKSSSSLQEIKLTVPPEAPKDPFALAPAWLTEADAMLHRDELLNLRLTVDTKSTAKVVGRQVAEHLTAHVAQVVGHTVLLYRPKDPPALDLAAMVARSAA